MKCIIITDLPNDQGRHIPGNQMNGEWHASSTLIWSRLPKSPAKYRAVFRWCIQGAFSSIRKPGFLKQAVRLDQPIGPWRKTERHIQYKYYCTKDEAFNWDNDHFLHYNNPATKAQIFEAHGIIETLPLDAHPIDVSHDVNSLWTTNKYLVTNNVPRPNDSVLDYVVNGNGPKLAGSDGSVDILSSNRASAYCIQVGGHRFGGARQFPSS